jgi:hypothetical protein
MQMATITVDQQKLVMNSFAAQFQNSLVSADVVTWKQFDTEMNDRNGLNVAEQVGPRYDVTETTNGVKDLSSGVQDSVFGSEQFVVNKTFGTSMGWGDFIKIRDIGDARESQAIKSAAANLAEHIDAYVMGVAGTASNNWTGDAANGDPVAAYLDIVNAYTRIKEEGIDDSDLRAVLTYGDKAALGDNVVELPGVDTMSANTYRSAFTGAVGGIPTMFTQQLPVLTVGDRVASASVAVDGGTQNVDYSSVAVSAAPGQYMTQTINITLPNTRTVLAGEVFTIAGVFAYDNRKGAAVSPPRLQQFTVVTGGTGNGTNDATIRIFPAMIVPGTGSGGDILVNNAHATVTAVAGATAAMTFLGAASATLAPRLLLKKDSILVNTAPLILPASGKAMRQSLSKIPLTVRMWQDSDFNTGEHKVRFDVALTANVRERRHIVRINGNAA